MSKSLDDLFPRDSGKQRFKDEKPERDKARSKATAESGPRKYGKNAAKLFAEPTPSATITERGLSPVAWRGDPSWLIPRALAGDLLAREALIEIVERLGTKTLRTYEPEIRARAILAVTDRLFGYGMLGLGIVLHFDPSCGGAFIGWAAKALKNAAIDEWRKKRLFTIPYSAEIEDEDGEEDEHSPALKPQGHDSEGKPIIPGAAIDEPSRQGEGRERLAAALAALDDRERSILLATAEGDSPEEIAGRFELSPSRVRAIVAEARAKARAAAAAD